MNILDIDAINATIDLIRDEERFMFNLGSWLYKPVSSCRTVGCIAGAAIVASGRTHNPKISDAQQAAEILGLDGETANLLFIPILDVSYETVTAAEAICTLEILRDVEYVAWQSVIDSRKPWTSADDQ